MKCEEKFFEIYGKEPESVSFSPYRVCPIGAHSDHNLGKITGLAINKGIYFAYSPTEDGSAELVSLQFSKAVGWNINSAPKEKQGDWADYLRGAAIYLGQRHALTKGVRGVIEGELPIGGLSSSAAVTLAFITALCRANGIALTPRELIDASYESERNYVGVSIGKLDQSCEVLCKKNSLLYLDTLDDSFELIPESSEMKPYKIAVFFSGLEHDLTGSKYNMRADELRAGAYALKAFAGMEYGKFGETAARQVPPEVYRQYADRLPEPWRKRCEHWFTEFERTEKGAEAWRKGDIEEFGRLSFESGRSSVENWQSGAPEQIKLYEIMTETEGIYGGRFAGAGFKGCCFALIDPHYEDEIERKVAEAYLKEYPLLRDKYRSYICETENGIAAVTGE